MEEEITEKREGKYYLESYKKEVVAEIEREGRAIKRVCGRHGLPIKTVNRWIQQYASITYRENGIKKLNFAEKNKIVREIISGRLTVSQVQLKYKLNCRDTILKWLRDYKKTQHNPDRSPEPGCPIPEKDLMLTDMQKELEMARLKIRALEVMVDIASDQFKVNIRKKFGAKQ